ncbi:MAG: MBL fold metallo-hydrolase [Lachnospiraceae bacterium]|nr:MAG: MBL fold metallo-hydrolase [Lachnospiraceae bacterium]
MKKNNLKKYIILILLLSSFFYTFFSYVQKNFFQVSNHNLRFHFIDVGQGDSSLIITPNGKTILIDAGDEAHAKKVVSYIREQGIEKLDLVIATHPDADHIGGMDKVIKNFDIDVFAMPDVSAKTNQYKQIQRELKAKKMKTTRLYQGDEVQIDDDIDFEILSPVKGKKYDDTNEYSIVAKIVYKDTSFILMGDATMENEVDIINNIPDIDIDVLKLGHHGSSTSSSDYFITKTSPNIAIISCGKNNKYGHPHQEVMRVLKKHGVTPYRTDEMGDIVITSDGKEIKYIN